MPKISRLIDNSHSRRPLALSKIAAWTSSYNRPSSAIRNSHTCATCPTVTAYPCRDFSIARVFFYWVNCLWGVLSLARLFSRATCLWHEFSTARLFHSYTFPYFRELSMHDLSMARLVQLPIRSHPPLTLTHVNPN